MLASAQLYYFKSWEDYGAAGMRAAINSTEPIDIRSHEAVPMLEEIGGSGMLAAPHRFDLVSTANPLARRWQLQAGSSQEMSDWLLALDAARQLEAENGTRHAGQATVITTPRPPERLSHQPPFVLRQGGTPS